MKLTAEKPLGGKKKGKVLHISVRPAANGGFIARHERQMQKQRISDMMSASGPQEPPETAFSGPKAHADLMKHFAGLAANMHDDEGDDGESA